MRTRAGRIASRTSRPCRKWRPTPTARRSSSIASGSRRCSPRPRSTGAPRRGCRSTVPDQDLVNALAQYAAFEPIERQALLECDGVLSRCLALIELLEMKTMTLRGASWAGGSVHCRISTRLEATDRPAQSNVAATSHDRISRREGDAAVRLRRCRTCQRSCRHCAPRRRPGNGNASGGVHVHLLLVDHPVWAHHCAPS